MKRLAGVVKEHVLNVLRDCRFNRQQASAVLGISRRAIDLYLLTWGLTDAPWRRQPGPAPTKPRKHKTDQVRIRHRAWMEE